MQHVVNPSLTVPSTPWPDHCVQLKVPAQHALRQSFREKAHLITVSRVTPSAVACVTTTQSGRVRRGWAQRLVQFDPGVPKRRVVQGGVARQLAGERTPLDSGTRALANALEARDPETRKHSARVARFALVIARELGLDPSSVEAVGLGAELHDIGKIGVPDRLLRRPGPLSSREHREVLKHTLIGEQILRPVMCHRPRVLAVVRSHHEWYDGSGYPDGLKGERIPLEARIVAVADSLDAMTTARPYRHPLPLSEAIRQLIAFSGSQFDPECVRALLAALFRLTAVASRAQRPGARREGIGLNAVTSMRSWRRTPSDHLAARDPPSSRGPTTCCTKAGDSSHSRDRPSGLTERAASCRLAARFAR